MLIDLVIMSGGQGVRMENETFNKPKGLVSFDGMPISYRIMNEIRPRKLYFILNGTIFNNYIQTSLELLEIKIDRDSIEIVPASEKSNGSVDKISEVVNKIDYEGWLIICHCDLHLEEGTREQIVQSIQNTSKDLIIFSSDEIKTRKQIGSNPVVGLYAIKKRYAKKLSWPSSGSLSEFLSSIENKDIVKIKKITEIRDIETLKQMRGQLPCSRPFNDVQYAVIKSAKNKIGEELAVKEKNWFREANRIGVENIPKIYSWDPFVMEYFGGNRLWEIDCEKSKEKLVQNILEGLADLHAKAERHIDLISLEDAYIDKTKQRLKKVSSIHDIFEMDYFYVNGRKIRNPNKNFKQIERMIRKSFPEKFCFIHGDCTFSNTVLDHKNNLKTYWIDPRGYFGQSLLYGDPCYDYAKLYYSVVGNYDQFNLKKFVLRVNGNCIDYTVQSNGYEKFGELVEEAAKKIVPNANIRLSHALIWLSLTTYVIDCFDSVILAFVRGSELLEDLYEQ